MRVPFPARLRVVRNGGTFLSGEGRELRAAITEPGVYRVEARCEGLGAPPFLDLLQSALREKNRPLTARTARC